MCIDLARDMRHFEDEQERETYREALKSLTSTPAAPWYDMPDIVRSAQKMADIVSREGATSAQRESS